MSKQSGIGQRLYIGGYDLSGDVQKLDDVGGGFNALDFTDITQAAPERHPGIRDGRLGTTTYFNTATGREHLVLGALPTTDIHCMWAMGAAVGSEAFALVAKQANYDGARGKDGSFLFTVQAVANSFGGEFVTLLTAGSDTVVTGSGGTSYDTGASASFGGQAYLQVLAFSGTDVTVAIQDSADNVSFAAVAGLSFTQVTAAPASERVAISNTSTIRRYVRYLVSTSAGFTSVQFVVGLNKNSQSGVLF